MNSAAKVEGTQIRLAFLSSTGMRPLNASLEGLIALVTIAQEGSLERGGRTLGLDRSTIGKQIGGLEQAVGTPLFDRWRGRWILNEDGRLLAARAFQAILEIRMGIDLVQSHERLRTDHFAVGYSTFLSPILIGIIRQIEFKRHGDVTIEYESRLTESSVERVVRENSMPGSATFLSASRTCWYGRSSRSRRRSVFPKATGSR